MTIEAPETYSVAVTVSICPYDDLTNFGYRLGVFAAKHPTFNFDFETDDIYLDDDEKVGEDDEEADEDDEDFDFEDYEKDPDSVRVTISLKTQEDREYFLANFTGLS